MTDEGVMCSGGCGVRLNRDDAHAIELATGEQHTDLTCHILVRHDRDRLRASLEKVRAVLLDAGAGPLGWSLTLAAALTVTDDALRPAR